MAVHILGIRHHGPGSASNVKTFLEGLKPDIVLVEGPPEADAILQWADHPELKPPVAILLYQADDIQRSVFYPFAEFSPEWQAIQYARKNKIPVRFMDLPIAHCFALEQEQREKEKAEELVAGAGDSKADELENEKIEGLKVGGEDSQIRTVPMVNREEEDSRKEPEAIEDDIRIRRDPMAWLADAAGYTDAEKWWEHQFEYRKENLAVFEAVNEAMTVLREKLPQKEDRMEQLREAYMRKSIRQAEKEMYTEIAVICGAWHGPALHNMPKQKEDNELLKGLPKVKTESTWIPWTYGRLGIFSGYGAGIHSPGWYEHIWKYPKDDGTLWMAKVAKLFREKQMDTSVAHVIEAVRLAESLASLRSLSRAGLEELQEATLSVLCNGESVLLRLIHEELIVSNRIGEVPKDIPKPPLQVDIEKIQKRLRLPSSADWKDYTLDLRKDNDLERSIFLHRLELLGLKWAFRSEVSGKGTFKEQWRLQWDPGFVIDIIDRGVWGNTVEEASSAYSIHQAGEAASLRLVCELLERSLPAELPMVVEALIRRINNLSAASGDVIQLMEAIPPLVSVSRYGNVRKTDAELVRGIVTGMITRICVSLPAACTGVADDAASHILDLFFTLNEAVNVLQLQEITTEWQQTLFITSGGQNTAPVIAGYSTRLLADRKLLDGDKLVTIFYFAMSRASAPAIAAAWLEGFLKGSGTLLLIDEHLWSVVNDWVKQLDEVTFTQVLPLLRRTFANFTSPERKKLGEKVRHGGSQVMAKAGRGEEPFDHARAEKGLGVVMQLFGYQGRSPQL